MVNIIWIILIASGIIIGSINGNIDAVTEATFLASANAVKIAIEITGVLALWMGLLKIAEKSGLVEKIASLAGPLVKKLFPDLPKDHPANFAIVMNLAANFLGLGNAATPFGLKAMQHLQDLNHEKDAASPSMITFLALNTSSVTLIPMMVISLRAQAGSVAAGEIIGPTIIATCCGAVFAISFDRILRKWYFRK
ncbi:MAG: nucleoside recognition domain-containing protein [Bacillota bacterium]|jgi:spore maturation protein A